MSPAFQQPAGLMKQIGSGSADIPTSCNQNPAHEFGSRQWPQRSRFRLTDRIASFVLASTGLTREVPETSRRFPLEKRYRQIIPRTAIVLRRRCAEGLL